MRGPSSDPALRRIGGGLRRQRQSATQSAAAQTVPLQRRLRRCHNESYAVCAVHNTAGNDLYAEQQVLTFPRTDNIKKSPQFAFLDGVIGSDKALPQSVDKGFAAGQQLQRLP